MNGKRDYIDYQDRAQPLGYLITFRCYGTWLHGDGRGSIDRRKYNRYGTPDMPANKKILANEKGELRSPVRLLNPAQRKIVELAVREVCEHRRYFLHAVNVRTNHVHSVVSAPCKPEHIMDSFKSYATRKLRGAGLLGADIRPWARHGSTAYLWTKNRFDAQSNMLSTVKGTSRFRESEIIRVALAYARASDTM